MKTQSTTKSNSPKVRRRLKGVMALALACAMITGSASAVVFNDPIHTLQNILSQLRAQAQDIAEYTAEGQRWMQQYQHLQQQLIQLQGFMSTAMPMADNFEERAENYGLEQCGGDGSIVSWTETIIPDMNGEITEQQLKICQKLVMAENKKYNETIRMLRKLRDRAAEFQAIEERRGAVGSSQGKLDANNNDVNRFTTRMQMDLDYWQAMMTGYDSYIVSLNRDQQRLANQALKGRQNVFGTVMQGVALKAALEERRSRDR